MSLWVSMLGLHSKAGYQYSSDGRWQSYVAVTEVSEAVSRIKNQVYCKSCVARSCYLEPLQMLFVFFHTEGTKKIQQRSQTCNGEVYVYVHGISMYFMIRPNDIKWSIHSIYTYDHIYTYNTPRTWPGMPQARNTKAGRSARSRPTKYAKPCLSGLAGSRVRTVPQKETKSPECGTVLCFSLEFQQKNHSTGSNHSKTANCPRQMPWGDLLWYDHPKYHKGPDQPYCKWILLCRAEFHASFYYLSDSLDRVGIFFADVS